MKNYEFYGTEKQAKWAKDIVDGVQRDIEERTKDLKEREKRENFDYKSDKVHAKALDVLDGNIKKSNNDASFVINNRDKFKMIFDMCLKNYKQL